jgi:acyl carrier protein
MNIESIIERFIVEEIMMKGDETTIEPDQSLIESGILDSMSLLRVIGFLEERFDVTIEDEEVVVDNFETISSINALLARKMEG